LKLSKLVALSLIGLTMGIPASHAGTPTGTTVAMPASELSAFLAELGGEAEEGSCMADCVISRCELTTAECPIGTVPFCACVSWAAVCACMPTP
jgi:hypothetical protein